MGRDVRSMLDKSTLGISDTKLYGPGKLSTAICQIQFAFFNVSPNMTAVLCALSVRKKSWSCVNDVVQVLIKVMQECQSNP